MGLVDTTTYKVEAEMAAKDSASLVFQSISKSAEVASRSIEQLKHGMGLLGIGLGFHEAKKHLIDFNAQLEDSRVVMAGMLTMFTGASIDKSWDRAGESVDTFNKMAAKSSLTTKDLVDMASMIERPLLQAGVHMSDIESITFGAANAAKAFGINAQVAAMDIQQGLSSGVHIRDRFAMSVLAQKGIDYTPTKFNALDTAHRVEVFKKAFASAGILEMAKKQGEDTFHGVMSTLEDNMSLSLGKVGLPLFREITHEVAHWNDWLAKNDIEINKIATTVSQHLVTGFRYVREAAQFLYDHADPIIAIGKVWAITSLTGGVSGALGLGGGNPGAISGAFGNAWGGLTKSLAASFRSAVLSVGMRAPELIGPMSKIGSVAGGIGGALGGLGGAAGALGPSGIIGIGYAAHELGEYLGVHRALTSVIDPTRVKLENLKASLVVLDDQVRRTAQGLSGEKGALGSTNAVNALATVDLMKSQIEVLKDIQAGRKGTGEYYHQKLLRDVGYDSDEISKKGLLSPTGRLMEISKLSARSSTVGTNTYLASHQADIGLEAAMKLMTADQRANIDVKEATRMLMEKFMLLFSSSGYGMTGLNASLMSPEELKKMLLRDALDPFKGASINQNITNNIKVEVSAKDPDRWLHELDAKVARKIRAPSQARGAVITRGGW